VAVLLAQNAVALRGTAYTWSLLESPTSSMGAMTSPRQAHLFAFGAEPPHPGNGPTFAVPLTLMLHGLVLWCLPRETASTTGRWSLRDVARLINVAGEGEHASPSPDPDQAQNGGMAIQVHCHDFIYCCKKRSISSSNSFGCSIEEREVVTCTLSTTLQCSRSRYLS
jgi:hypothetical protein